MNLYKFVEILANSNKPISIFLPNGSMIPENFHITEVGRVTKEFIDCGGTQRRKEACVLQIWVADDLNHRLNSGKLLKILKLANLPDMPVEFEYQPSGLLPTISQYSLLNAGEQDFGLFIDLSNKETACLAPDKCGVSCCKPVPPSGRVIDFESRLVLITAMLGLIAFVFIVLAIFGR